MATEYLFVCGHDTIMLREQIERLKGSFTTGNKLAIASATPGFNVNKELEQAQPGVNYYGLRLSAPVYGKTMLPYGPFAKFKIVFRKMLDEGFMGVDSILAFKPNPLFRNKLLGINGEDEAKIDLLIKKVDEYIMRNSDDATRIESLRQAQTNLHNFKTNYLSSKEMSFDDFTQTMSRYGFPKEKASWNLHFEHYLENFGFDNEIISWLNAEKDSEGKNAGYLVAKTGRWMTKLLAAGQGGGAINGCLCDLYNLIFFIEIINKDKGGLSFIKNEEFKQKLLDTALSSGTGGFRNIIIDLNIIESDGGWKEKMDDFTCEIMEGFLTRYESYTNIPYCIIEDGETDDVLSTLLLKHLNESLLNRETIVYRQVPKIDSDSSKDTSIRLIHKMSQELDGLDNNTLLQDPDNKHIENEDNANPHFIIMSARMAIKKRSTISKESLDILEKMQAKRQIGYETNLFKELKMSVRPHGVITELSERYGYLATGGISKKFKRRKTRKSKKSKKRRRPTKSRRSTKMRRSTNRKRHTKRRR